MIHIVILIPWLFKTQLPSTNMTERLPQCGRFIYNIPTHIKLTKLCWQFICDYGSWLANSNPDTADCGDPPKDERASSNWSTTLAGDTAHYTYNAGHTFNICLREQLSMVCQDDGKWSRLQDECAGIYIEVFKYKWYSDKMRHIITGAMTFLDCLLILIWPGSRSMPVLMIRGQPHCNMHMLEGYTGRKLQRRFNKCRVKTTALRGSLW